MTNRRLCRRCVYYTKKDDICNHILVTGEKRAHDGDMCFSYEAASGRDRKPPEAVPQDKEMMYDAYRMYLHLMA